MAGVFWPPVVPSPITFVSETHIDNTSGNHVFSSISGLQAGDLMLHFAGGPYQAATATTGWVSLGDAGGGAAAMTSSAKAKFATSSSESVTITWGTNATANFSTLMVIRGASCVFGRAAQLQSGPGTTALSFPALTPTLATNNTPTTALVFVSGANTAVTFTISPTPIQTLLDYPSNGGRTQRTYQVPYNASYSATPSASDYRAGCVVHIL